MCCSLEVTLVKSFLFFSHKTRSSNVGHHNPIDYISYIKWCLKIAGLYIFLKSVKYLDSLELRKDLRTFEKDISRLLLKQVIKVKIFCKEESEKHALYNSDRAECFCLLFQ